MAPFLNYSFSGLSRSVLECAITIQHNLRTFYRLWSFPEAMSLRGYVTVKILSTESSPSGFFLLPSQCLLVIFESPCKKVLISSFISKDPLHMYCHLSYEVTTEVRLFLFFFRWRK